MMRYLRWLIISIIAILAYIYAIRVTDPDPVRLVTSLPQAADVVRQLLTPDLLVRTVTSYTLSVPVPIPCGSVPAQPLNSQQLIVQPACATVGEPIVVTGNSLGANAEVALRWGLPNGNRLPIEVITTNASGGFVYTTTTRPLTAARDAKAATFDAVVSVPGNRWEMSHTVKEVVNQLFITIFIALLATVISSLVAAPLAFMAARNLSNSTVGKVLYTFTRSYLNITRAFEPLVLATIFALIVGFGKPFAGVLGLIIGTIASLGKMFSEAVEDIDMGTVEAITATGANRSQVIAQAVVPQITPNWLAYMLYHWDINVRISTIIGFVGAGGIGEFLQKQIDTLSYRQAGTALLAIILVVWSLDFLSAQVRKRLI